MFSRTLRGAIILHNFDEQLTEDDEQLTNVGRMERTNQSYSSFDA